LLEVRPFVLALALGHLQGEVLRLGKVIVTPDTAGGRIKVHRASLQAKPRGRPDGTGREEPHRAKVVEAIEDTARGIVVQGLRGDCLTQKKLSVLLGEELF
jgi:hypothetical protein